MPNFVNRRRSDGVLSDLHACAAAHVQQLLWWLLPLAAVAAVLFDKSCLDALLSDVYTCVSIEQEFLGIIEQ